MVTIKAENRETGEVRIYQIWRKRAIVADNVGGRRCMAPDAAREEAAKLEWPWVRT